MKGDRPDPRLVDAITAAVVARGGKLEGGEYRFRCLYPDRHAHGDADPSARWNPAKAVWRCDVCDEGGGAVDLARRLNLDRPARTPVEPPNLGAWAAGRALPLGVLRRYRVETTTHAGRPGLVYPTALGVDRVKYTDGARPKYRWVRAGGRAHWYGLTDALALLKLALLKRSTSALTLYVVNGEPAVWACAAEDAAAVCLCGERVKITDELIDELRDALGKAGLSSAIEVRIVYDADRAGRDGAAAAVDALRAAGFEDVAALDLAAVIPDVPGADVDDLHRRVAEKLAEVLAALPVFTSEAAQEPETDARRQGVVLVPAATITPAPVVWAWRDRVPLGAVTLLVGDPGLGKSTLMIELAARWSRGQLEGDLRGQPVTVALATAEDAIAQVVVPRLLAAGADLERVVIVTVQRDGLRGGLVLPDDLGALREQLLAASARVLVVDPLVAHLPGDVNSHRDQDVRRALAPLARLAEETAAAVNAIVHLNKSQVSHVLGRVCGSVGFVAAARSVLLLGPDPEDTEGPTRVLAHAKSNLSPLAPALRLRIEERHLSEPAIRTSRLVWCGEAQGVSASDLVAPEAPEERSKRTEAQQAILELLAGGPVEAKAAEAELDRRGVATRTWKRAKRELGVRSIKHGFPGEWYWALTEGCHSPKMAPFDAPAPNRSEEAPKNAEECHVREGCHGPKADDAGTVRGGWEEGVL